MQTNVSKFRYVVFEDVWMVEEALVHGINLREEVHGHNEDYKIHVKYFPE